MGETYRDPTMGEWSRPGICCTCGNLVGDRTVHDQHHADLRAILHLLNGTKPKVTR